MLTHIIGHTLSAKIGHFEGMALGKSEGLAPKGRVRAWRPRVGEWCGAMQKLPS